MKRNLFAAAALAVLFVSSCAAGHRTVLSGVMAERSYEVGTDYSALEISSAIDVIYSPSARNVTVRADSAVIDMIRVERKGDGLKIYRQSKENGVFITGDTGEVSVEVPVSGALESVGLSGASDFLSEACVRAGDFYVSASGASRFRADLDVSGDVSIEASGASDVTADIVSWALSVDASGASSVKISGKAGSYSISASGASSVSSGSAFVEADTVVCDISGASGCHVKCNVSAEGEVSGASRIVVYGEGEVSVTATGASSVHRR